MADTQLQIIRAGRKPSSILPSAAPGGSRKSPSGARAALLKRMPASRRDVERLIEKIKSR